MLKRHVKELKIRRAHNDRDIIYLCTDCIRAMAGETSSQILLPEGPARVIGSKRYEIECDRCDWADRPEVSDD